MTRFLAPMTAFVALLAAMGSAQANGFFVDQSFPSTGSFEWDVFDLNGTIGFAGPHPPDAGVSGVGAAQITAAAIAVVPPGGVGPMVTGSNSLYVGTNIGRITASLGSLVNSGANTTVVLQVAMAGTPASQSSLLLNGAAGPTQFVDRGAAADGRRYYWAEWQTGAATNLSLEFAGGPHMSVAGVQVDYFNSASTVNAVAPALVPEPTSLALGAFGVVGAAVCRARFLRRSARRRES